MKKVISKILCVLLSVAMLAPATVFASDTNSKTETKKPTITFTESIYMIKGKYEYVNISNYDENTIKSFKTSDRSIVAVTKEGKIKAKKCGKATVTVKVNKNGISYITKIKVTVAISRNRITKVYGTKTEQVSPTSSSAVVKLPVAIKVNKTTNLKVSNIVEGDEVTYTSSDKSVAKVDKKGKITALKKGTAIITATVKRDGKKVKCKEKIKVVKAVTDSNITKKERNSYYGTSAFIGSSIGVGQKAYFNSQGKNYLGSPLMLVRGCYSFNNDNNNNKKYMVQYKGVSMKAKNAVKKSGVDKVFIAMGTNDLFEGVDTTYKKYVAYVEGIRKKNPKVVIFIESTTSVYATSQKKQLNSKNVAKLNKKMEKYCSEQKDIYFVDVSSKMNDKNGNIKAKYCSDHYVHLTNAAYELWMNELTAYTDKLMIKQQNAEDAVETAVESKDASQIAKAKKLVKKLDKSTIKSNLNKQLKNL